MYFVKTEISQQPIFFIDLAAYKNRKTSKETLHSCEFFTLIYLAVMRGMWNSVGVIQGCFFKCAWMAKFKNNIDDVKIDTPRGITKFEEKFQKQNSI